MAKKGVLQSKEAKEKHRQCALKQFKNGMPQATKDKLSLSHKGKHHSEKWKKKMSEIAKKDITNKGRFKKGMIPYRKGLVGFPSSRKGKRYVEYITKECPVCKNTFDTPIYLKDKITCNKKECKRMVYSLGKKGNKNPSWNNGSSFGKYGFEFNKQFKQKIRDRDSNKCRISGISEIDNGRKLPIHHIDYDKQNCREDNLITLSTSWHSKTNGSKKYPRQFWNNLFTLINALMVQGVNR